ncbi:hypothetical protein Tco_0800039 [Tanacetum coccineum]|uniref:Uncharacterized protein n=1 Tax=Tanacetum coccineum TaxID=301880 RepID=A0ABQ4ZUB1_9ASTR
MINQLHNISTILDSHINPSNAYIHAPPSPPPQPIHPPSHAQVLAERKEIDDVGEVSTIWKSESVGVLKLQDGCSTRILAY